MPFCVKNGLYVWGISFWTRVLKYYLVTRVNNRQLPRCLHNTLEAQILEEDVVVLLWIAAAINAWDDSSKVQGPSIDIMTRLDIFWIGTRVGYRNQN